jgi:iron complex outermembrane receptor protein
MSGLFFSSAASAEDQPSLKEITVTAKGTDVAERREATTQKVVMDRKEIEKMSVMTIGEVLGKLPGVELTGGMGQRARGMSRDSVQILVDGERSAGGGLPAIWSVSRSCAVLRRSSAVQPPLR